MHVFAFQMEDVSLVGHIHQHRSAFRNMQVHMFRSVFAHAFLKYSTITVFCP